MNSSSLTPSTVDLYPEIIEFIRKFEEHASDTACYFIKCEDVFQYFSGYPREHCIVVPLQGSSAENLEKQFGAGGVAELTSDDEFANLIINNGIIRLPIWLVENARYNPPIPFLVVIAKDYAAIFEIVPSVYSEMRYSNPVSAWLHEQKSETSERAHISKDAVITIKNITRVTCEDESLDDSEEIPF